MAQCTDCELVFQTDAPLIVSVVFSGADVLVYTENNGRNILFIKLLILCMEYPNGQYVRYIRNSDLIYGERLEQGTTALQFQMAAAPTQAQASAQYIEITGRAVSCVSVP